MAVGYQCAKEHRYIERDVGYYDDFGERVYADNWGLVCIEVMLSLPKFNVVKDAGKEVHTGTSGQLLRAPR